MQAWSPDRALSPVWAGALQVEGGLYSYWDLEMLEKQEDQELANYNLWAKCLPFK